MLKTPSKITIRENGSLKRFLFTAILILILLSIVGFMLFSRKKQRKENIETAFTVETAQITRQTLSDSISATGTIASAETKTVNTSLKDLEVVAVYVKEGDYVEEGTVICQFDSSDYEEELTKAQHNASINAQLEAFDASNNSNETLENAYDNVRNTAKSKNEADENCEDAETDYESAKKALNKASSALSAAKKNYEAISDELNATPSALTEQKNAYENALKELAKAQVTLAEKKATYEKDTTNTSAEEAYNNAQTEVTSKENLVNDTKSKYDVAATRYNELLSIEDAYKSAQANYDSAQAEVSSTKQVLEQAKSKLEQAEDQLDSAWKSYDKAEEKAKLQEEREALEDQLINESQEEKAIDEYSELIDDCVVKAAMSGVITSLNVTEGNVFSGGDVYTIQDNEHFIVTCSVDEYDISSIKKGMTAYVKTDATGDVQMNGEVTYVAIAPSGSGSMGAISSSASYTIKVAIQEADENLRAGMTAKLSISLEESENTLTVPYDAVTTAPDGTATITADVNGEKKTITVETGLETDYYTEIFSDEISEGMTVYLTTPMIQSTPSGSEDENLPFGGFMNRTEMPSGNDRPGGKMPDGGGMPSGGGPGGF